MVVRENLLSFPLPYSIVLGLEAITPFSFVFSLV